MFVQKILSQVILYMYNNVMILSEVPTVSAALNLIYFCHKKGVVDNKGSLGLITGPLSIWIIICINGTIYILLSIYLEVPWDQ